MMWEALRGRHYKWLEKDRAMRRGGGLGMVVANALPANIAKTSRSENLLWVEIHNDSKWYIARVFAT